MTGPETRTDLRRSLLAPRRNGRPRLGWVSPTRLWRQLDRPRRLTILMWWLGSLVLSVYLGVLATQQYWVALPLQFGGAEVRITLYPPLLLNLLWTLTFGWVWGAVPAYAATLAIGLSSGMPWAWAALFACADPLGLGVAALGYQVNERGRRFRSWSAPLYFVMLVFVSSIYSASGALIWAYVGQVDSSTLLSVWQGWWLGDVIQSSLFVGPVLWLVWPRVARWQLRHAAVLSSSRPDMVQSVLKLLAMVTVGVLIYGATTLWLANAQLQGETPNDLMPRPDRVNVLSQTAWVFYWTFALIILFNALFCYRLFANSRKVSMSLLWDLHRANQRLEKLARYDGLSGLLNRHSADEIILTEWLRANRLRTHSALLMIDIDHFKSINDRFGHEAGDVAIQHVANVLKNGLRRIDALSRFGGEEFVAILPQIEPHAAQALAERLRQDIASSAFAYREHEIPLSVSIGVAFSDCESVAAWLKQADNGLYLAKSNGRNAVTMMH
ncbi:diguanylate cyclase [Aquabacterium sp.]|uniref:sensor domain-containing diguanylate cyclase n=1 Tax=Aquabacterium sp. TaxID=1872578 RepID=UPI0035B28E2E